MFSRNAQFLSIAHKVYQEYLSHPFRADTWFNRLHIQTHLKCPDGQIIYRPNHGLAHSIRVANYIPMIWEYFKKNGDRDESGHDLYGFDALTEQEVQKIQIAALFYVVGREDETGFRHNPERYNSYRKASADKFRAFCEKYDLIPSVFDSTEDMEMYAKFLHEGEHGMIEAKRTGATLSPLRILLSTAHELDLARCFPEFRVHRDLIEEKLNFFAKYGNSRDMQALVLYAQACITATGDMLSTAYQIPTHLTPGDSPEKTIRPLHHRFQPFSWLKRLKLFKSFYSFFYPQYYQFDLFAKASSDANACLTYLDAVPKPKFLGDSLKQIQVSASEALCTIQSGNAAIRLMTIDSDSNQPRFEFEQLADPQCFRPIYFSKMSQIKEESRQFILDLRNQKVIRRKFNPGPSQDASDTSTIYYDENNALIPKPVSTQTFRGQMKNTPYTKKSPYTLLRRDGRIKHFHGSYLGSYIKQLFGSHHQIGFLCDIRNMHLKGEKYLFPADVGTTGPNGYFWLGENASKKPSWMFPERQTPVTMEALKETINADIPKRRGRRLLLSAASNEMLICASQASLKALFCKYNTLSERIYLLSVATQLKVDYGLALPLLIIDGKSNPCEYNSGQQEVDMQRLKERFFHYNPIIKGYYRIFHAGVWKQYQKIQAHLKNHYSHKTAATSYTTPLPNHASEVCYNQSRAGFTNNDNMQDKNLRKTGVCKLSK